MIPFVAVVSLRNEESRTFRVWIPLFLVWLFPILSIPFVIYSLMFWWRLAMKE